jgi:hypothetical protein
MASLFALKAISCNVVEDINETGILVLYTGNYTESTSYKILNLDKSVFTEIKSREGNEPSAPKLKNKILAYYEDYYIFHFYAKVSKDASFYLIKVGQEFKMIEIGKNMRFYSWEEYVLKFYCSATENNPLRVSPTAVAEKVKVDYEHTSFKCKEIKNDWVRVECDIDCEGCPNNKAITGWIRWRKDGKIILKQHYSC